MKQLFLNVSDGSAQAKYTANSKTPTALNKVEVLVATINQENFSIVEQMNIRTDAVIANQSDKCGYAEMEIDSKIIKMVSTNTKGAGINRNMAIAYSTGDVLLFADDDVVYEDNYEDIILSAFRDQPTADVIMFNFDVLKKGKIVTARETRIKRLRLYNALKYGTIRIAIKRNSLLKSNLHFFDSFGPGCKYNMNEDALFIIDCLNKGLKLYAYPGYLGSTVKDTSSWFRGFDEKFWYNKGAFVAAAFPGFQRLLIIYFLWRFRNSNEITFNNRIKHILNGVRGYAKQLSYDEYYEHISKE